MPLFEAINTSECERCKGALWIPFQVNTVFEGIRAVLDRVPELEFYFVRLWRFRRTCVRLAFRYSGAVQPQAEGPDRARNILNALLAQIVEADCDLMADMIAHAAGHANTTGL